MKAAPTDNLGGFVKISVIMLALLGGGCDLRSPDRGQSETPSSSGCMAGLGSGGHLNEEVAEAGRDLPSLALPKPASGPPPAPSAGSHQEEMPRADTPDQTSETDEQAPAPAEPESEPKPRLPAEGKPRAARPRSPRAARRSGTGEAWRWSSR